MIETYSRTAQGWSMKLVFYRALIFLQDLVKPPPASDPMMGRAVLKGMSGRSHNARPPIKLYDYHTKIAPNIILKINRRLKISLGHGRMYETGKPLKISYGWIDGRAGGWVGANKAGVRDCLAQSKN